MNESFYALKREVKAIESDIASLDRKMSLWEEYTRVKPMIEKYNALTGKTQKATYEKYKGKIDNALELQKMWADFQKEGGKIAPKQWGKERAKLQKDISLCEWKMKALKDEIGSAERIQQVVTQLINEQQQGKAKIMER